MRLSCVAVGGVQEKKTVTRETIVHVVKMSERKNVSFLILKCLLTRYMRNKYTAYRDIYWDKRNIDF